MLPLLDKPAIQYVVEEAVRAGLTDILIITGRGKRSIEDHFDRSFELEHFLEAKGKFDELKQVREISDMASIHYIRQRDPLGLGHAVAVAEAPRRRRAVRRAARRRHHRGEHARCCRTCSASTRGTGGACSPRWRSAREEISLYGCIEPEFVENEHLARVRSIVEKPDAGGGAVEPRRDRPLRAHARDLRLPASDRSPACGGEIQLTDAINLLAQEQAVYAYVFEGGRFDVGNKLDYLKATIELAIDRDDIGKDFRAYLADLVERKKLL